MDVGDQSARRSFGSGSGQVASGVEGLVGPLVARIGRHLFFHRSNPQLAAATRFTITYPDNVGIEAPIGMSVLEVSRMARRAHVSVCGGRARCTTCRVQIVSAAGNLPAPEKIEAEALGRISAPNGVRLACQLRSEVDLVVQPLLHPSLAAPTDRASGHEFGDERQVTILFADIRGSTSLAETRLPYDVVFLLNALFRVLADVVEKSGGYYSNFTGDGLMALFGLDQKLGQGARAALRCALRMFEELHRFNHRLAIELQRHSRSALAFILAKQSLVGWGRQRRRFYQPWATR